MHMKEASVSLGTINMQVPVLVHCRLSHPSEHESPQMKQRAARCCTRK